VPRCNYWRTMVGLALGVLAFASSPSIAFAQSGQQIDEARKLFLEARQLVAERQYAEACPKFEKSLEIERGIGTMYNLADCWELLGRTASAFRMFVSTAKAARSIGQDDRAKLARERAAALLPRLSRLLVTVGAPAEGITVWRNDSQIDETAWGVASVIDPGVYQIKATAPGKQTWTARVEIPERATTISVTVPPLVDVAATSKPVVVPVPAPKTKTKAIAAAPNAAPLPPPERPPYADSSSGSNRLIALSIGAAGVGALVAGVVLALDYRSKNDEASGICPAAVNCSRAEVERHGQLVDDARTARNWAYLAFGVGGAAIAGATAIYVASPSPRARSSARVGVSPMIGARGPIGAALLGNF
jgi:hypothetical protein